MTLPRRVSAMLAMAIIGVSAVVVASGSAMAARTGQGRSTGLALGGAHGPMVRLVVAQRTLTIPRFGSRVFLDPGIWVAAVGSNLEFRVSRPNYTRPATLTQVILQGRGHPRNRRLSSRLLAGWNGLARFFQLTVRTTSGTVVASKTSWFCPDSYDPQRASPDGPMKSPYPSQCSPFDPFPRGEVWGIARGWAVDPMAFGSPSRFKLAVGT